MLAAALAAVLLASPAAAPASTTAPAGPAADLARKVQALYERTRDLEARFTQTYVYAGLGRKLVSTGTLKVKKPGLMRWDYATPSKKTIAVTGSRLVQWEPEERQAYVDERFDATAMSAAVTFLLGQGDLAREFHLALGEGGALVLTPKADDPRVQRITLTVGPEGEVLGTAVLDGAGNENRLVFEQTKRNAGLADADFHVAVPKDARRIGPPGK
ncbi:MAG TPA: outer membrane lipoprotein carrier protein LolA [Anaeromyxobacteraceae bacterium]|nr:outer membrane lipoprotein carrier protein LolA [Anaeromyxobacteraceae bacterium]